MAGVIIENLSGRKLFVLIFTLLSLQLACFLIGGLIAPAPSNSDTTLAFRCIDDGSNKWLYKFGKGKCKPVPSFNGHHDITDINHVQMANKLVFVFQVPLIRDNIQLDYSRWQQTLIGILQFDVLYTDDSSEMPADYTVTMDIRLGYRNKGDNDNDWKLHTAAIIQRPLSCTIENKKPWAAYNCSIVPLFDLGSLHHDYYLLNIRLPADEKRQINSKLDYLADLGLVTINQNGGFTQVWLILKTTFLPLVIGTMIWFWNRVRQLKRDPVLLEYMLLTLGGSLTLLNCPFEFFTLWFDLPVMPLLQDIRQGIFHATLLSFWLVFAGEHLMIQDPQPHHLKIYWKHLSAVGTGCVSLLIFDVFEKGSQISNPFFSIWVSSLGTNLALAFIICAAISASLYFMFLCYMIYRVMCNISIKKSSLPSMCSVRRLHYEGIIYRFKFLMLATLICAAMTIVGFILDQASEERWIWDDHLQIEYTSAFLTGVYGMWNTYILALLILYSPSHKQWPAEMDLNVRANDEIELSHISAQNEPNEISLLNSFAKKIATD